MKTIKQIVAACCVAAMFFLVTAPASAQFASMDAEFAHFDGANGADGTDSAYGSATILNSVGDAAVAHSLAELRLNKPSLTKAEWKAYGVGLEDALASDHQGLQNSVLQLIIAYSDNLKMSRTAVVDVMRLYRDGDTDQIRRMAVVALGQIQSGLAVDYLERSYQFEKVSSVKKTILAVVNQSKSGS